MVRFIIIGGIAGATVLVGLLAPWAVAQPRNGIRAALDFTFRVDDGGHIQDITCDRCGYDFRDGSGQIATLSVHAAGGYVEVSFLDFGAAASNWSSLIDPHRPAVESSSAQFEVEFFRIARVREGQTLKLQGRSIEFTLIDAFGRGCPPGTNC